jgi:hypothetical protein
MSDPRVDGVGYGFRVTGLLINPYGRRGHIDHQILSLDTFGVFGRKDSQVEALVAPTGFEPVISTLKGWRPGPG